MYGNRRSLRTRGTVRDCLLKNMQITADKFLINQNL